MLLSWFNAAPLRPDAFQQDGGRLVVAAFPGELVPTEPSWPGAPRCEPPGAAGLGSRFRVRLSPAAAQYLPLPEDLRTWGRFSPDGRTLALEAGDKNGSASSLKLLDTVNGREKLTIPIRDQNTRVVISGFSPDGQLLAANCWVYARPKKGEESQSFIKWWDIATGREAASFAAEKNESFMWWSRFSPDGQIFAATNRAQEKAKIFLFSVPNRKLVMTLILAERREGESLVALSPFFSPDGKWIALITQALPANADERILDVHDEAQSRIHLIDVAAGEIRETLIAPQSFPWSGCFSPDGRTLATSGHGRVLLWDLTKPGGSVDRARNP